MDRSRHTLRYAIAIGIAAAFGYSIGAQRDFEDPIFMNMAMAAAIASVLVRSWWSILIVPGAIFAGTWPGRIFACGSCPFWYSRLEMDDVAGLGLVVAVPSVFGAAFATWLTAPGKSSPIQLATLSLLALVMFLMPYLGHVLDASTPNELARTLRDVDRLVNRGDGVVGIAFQIGLGALVLWSAVAAVVQSHWRRLRKAVVLATIVAVITTIVVVIATASATMLGAPTAGASSPSLPPAPGPSGPLASTSLPALVGGEVRMDRV